MIGVGISKTIALEKLVALKVRALPLKANPAFTADFEKWRRDVRVAIENIFPGKPQHLADYNQVTFDFPPSVIIDIQRFDGAFFRQVEILESMLQSMIEEIREFWEERDIEANPHAPTAVSKANATKPDPRRVFVVHGRNLPVRNSMFEFLRAIGLDPLEWSEAVHATRKTLPYVGEVLDAAFAMAQAVVVVMTPDDFAWLRPDLQTENDPSFERVPTGQARPQCSL